MGSGKACLLRVICEVAEVPFTKEHGLLGELLHVLLTPSTTGEDYEEYDNHEYHDAEAVGRMSNGFCRTYYPGCLFSPLNYFTRILDYVASGNEDERLNA